MGKCKRCGKEVRFPIMLHSTCWELEVSRVAEIFCDRYCRFPVECKSEDELYEHCDSCELIDLLNLGGGRFREESQRKGDEGK